MTSSQRALEIFLKLPESIQFILKKNKAFLAGGSILSGILDRKVNDYDLWFPQNFRLVDCFNDLLALGADIKFNSDNAWTLKLFDEFKIQCIKKHIGEPTTILRGFDFKFCQIGIECASQELIEIGMTGEQIEEKALCSPVRTWDPELDQVKEEMRDINIENLAFIALLDTGNLHQICVNKENSELILKLICKLENGIKLLDTPLEGIKVRSLDD